MASEKRFWGRNRGEGRVARPVLIALLLLSTCWMVAPIRLMAFDSADAQKTNAPFKLLRVTPSGEDVPPGNQLVFEFSRPVVPLGRMERDASEIPIAIEPRLDCQWRWLNASTLSCRLDDKKGLVPSTAYRITVGPGLNTLDGLKLGELFPTPSPRSARKWRPHGSKPGFPPAVHGSAYGSTSR